MSAPPPKARRRDRTFLALLAALIASVPGLAAATFADTVQAAASLSTATIAPVTDLACTGGTLSATLHWTASPNATSYQIRNNGVLLATQTGTSYSILLAGVGTYSVTAAAGTWSAVAVNITIVSLGGSC